MESIFDMTKMLYAIKHINDFYNKICTETADKCGISKAEADILIFLNNNPACDSAKDIVKLKGFSKAYVSKAVEPLLAKGLISIKVDEEDRRCQHLKITAKANPILLNLKEMQQNFFKKITDGISQEDIETHLHVINRFSENAQK